MDLNIPYWHVEWCVGTKVLHITSRNQNFKEATLQSLQVHMACENSEKRIALCFKEAGIVIVHQTVISRKESNVRGIFPNKQLQSQF